MLKTQKSLWINTVKLLSTDLAADFCDELECSEVYTDEIRKSIRSILSQNIDSGDYDLWNAGLENNIPTRLLDNIEEEYDEDTACDLEDYFIAMENKLVLSDIFSFWFRVFEDGRQNDMFPQTGNDEAVNDSLKALIISYIDYVDDFHSALESARPTSDWDTKLNSIGYIYIEDCDSAIEIDVTRQLIEEFAFSNISYEFWGKVNEMSGGNTEQLKAFAVSICGEECLPMIPDITLPDEEDDSTDEYEDED